MEVGIHGVRMWAPFPCEAQKSGSSIHPFNSSVQVELQVLKAIEAVRCAVALSRLHAVNHKVETNNVHTISIYIYIYERAVLLVPRI